MITDGKGRQIWRRGGRVENLHSMLSKIDTPAGALKQAAADIRENAEKHRRSAKQYLQWADEQDKQAAEIEEAVRKLEGKP